MRISIYFKDFFENFRTILRPIDFKRFSHMHGLLLAARGYVP